MKALTQAIIAVIENDAGGAAVNGTNSLTTIFGSVPPVYSDGAASTQALPFITIADLGSIKSTRSFAGDTLEDPRTQIAILSNSKDLAVQGADRIYALFEQTAPACSSGQIAGMFATRGAARQEKGKDKNGNNVFSARVTIQSLAWNVTS